LVDSWPVPHFALAWARNARSRIDNTTGAFSMDQPGRLEEKFEPILILDDGELEDVHEILLELGFGCERLRGGAIADGTKPPSDLLVSTPRRIGAVEP